LVRTRCEGSSAEEEHLVAALAAQLRKEVRRAQSSLRSGLAEANAMLHQVRLERQRRSPEHA
jgi:hypothetical protein